MRGDKPAISPSSKQISLEIKCECGHAWNYKPRDPNKIPKRPHSKCKKCNKWFEIKRTKLIKSNNYLQLGIVKKCREKIGHCGKIEEELVILKYLDKGLYAQEIARKGLFSAKNLSRIINSMKSRGLITQIHAFPKFYQCTIMGKVFLDRGEISEKQLQNKKSERKKLPDWVNQIRVHKLRFKDKLISKPSWLRRIKKEGYYSGLYIKRIELTNWTKFIIIFNYQDFNGLEKIEVCNKVIIYNFNRKIYRDV